MITISSGDRRIKANRERYISTLESGYRNYDTPNEILTPELSQKYPHKNWHYTVSATTAYQAIITALPDWKETIWHPEFGWPAIPGIIRGMGRKISYYPTGDKKITTEIDLEWLKENHHKIHILTIVHLYGNVVDIKPIRDIVGPECIIIEDVAQSYDVMGDYLHLNTGKYSDFCIVSFGKFKSPGGWLEGGAFCYKDDSWKDFFKHYFMSGIAAAQSASIPIVCGTKNSMSVADALVVKEDIKIIKEMEGKRKRKELATAIYNALDVECPMPNNNLWYSVPVMDLEESKKKKLRDADVRYKSYADFRSSPILYDGSLQKPNRQESIILLPCHEYLTDSEANFVLDLISS